MHPRPDLVPLRPGFTPRPWQIDAARALAEHVRLGTKRVTTSAACGCGKGDLIASMIVKAVWRGRRVGFGVHRDYLLDDVYERALAIEPALYAGRVKGRINEPDRHAVFMSLQTVRNEERAAQIGKLDWLFIDEGHWWVCDSGFAVINTLQAINPGLRIAMFTATPYRSAGKGRVSGLGAMFGPDVGGLEDPIYEYGLADGIRDRILSPIEALREVPLYARAPSDEDGKRIAELLDTDAHNDAVVDAYLRHRAPGIAFCASVPHAIHLAERFRRAGVKAEAVWDSSSSVDPTTGQRIGKDPDRARKLAAIQSGELEVLTNLDLLSTGFDCRRLEVMMSVRPTGSTGLFAQQVGRVTRLSPESGKARGLVLDFVDNTLIHNLGLGADLSVPTIKERTVDLGDVVRHRYDPARAEGVVDAVEEGGRFGVVLWRGHPTGRHSADELIVIRHRQEREVVAVVPAINGLQEFPVEIIRGDREAGWYAYTSSTHGPTWTMRVALPEGEGALLVKGGEVWCVVKVRDEEGKRRDNVSLWRSGFVSSEDAREWATHTVRERDGRVIRYSSAPTPSSPQQHGFLRVMGKRSGLEKLTKGEASALGDALSSLRAIGDHLDPSRIANRERYSRKGEEAAAK